MHCFNFLDALSTVEIFWFQLAVLPVTATKRAQTRSCTIGKYNRIFVIGDSFVDNGNRDPDNSTYTAIGSVNQSWQPPFGRTRPGKPAGRFSDGKVLSDFLGIMFIPPRPCKSALFLMNYVVDWGENEGVIILFGYRIWLVCNIILTSGTWNCDIFQLTIWGSNRSPIALVKILLPQPG